MNERVHRNCDITAANSLAASKAFTWDSGYAHVAFAASYPDRVIEVERLKAAKKLISRDNSVFSALSQDAVRTAVAAQILRSPDPEASMQRIKETYKILKTRFMSGEYTAVAAVIVSDSGKDPRIVADKMRKIYDLMNSKHFFLTSYDDLAVVALMASSDKTPEQIVGESEAIYANIRGDFFSKGDAYAISNLLALYDEPAPMKAQAAVRIREELKAAGIRFGSYGTAAVIAPLAILSLSNDNRMLVREIVEAERYLSGKKILGGIMGVGKNVRSMFAVSAVIGAFSDDTTVASVGATTAAISAVIAEEIAIMACMCACIAASSASTSASTC